MKSSFSDYYSELYENGNSSPDYEKALDAGDEYRRENPDFVQKFNALRGDILSSDREVAAFGYALADSGIIENFSESEPEELTETTINDKTPYLRETLNQFSEKHGLGELNVESNKNGYQWNLTETLQDGTVQEIDTISNSEYGMPFTPETLQHALENIEKSAEIRGQKISERYGRQDFVARHGGISELPKVQKNLPEIVYASSPTQKIIDNLAAIREVFRLEKAEENGEELYDQRSNQYNSKVQLI